MNKEEYLELKLDLLMYLLVQKGIFNQKELDHYLNMMIDEAMVKKQETAERLGID